MQHVLADRLDHPCNINAPNTHFGCAEPEADDAHQVGFARHQMPVTNVHASGMHTDEHVVEPDFGPVDVPELENVR